MTESIQPKLSARGVWKFFGPRSGHPALRDVSLDVADNGFVTLVGASGCGKSTLLRTLGGLESFDAGTLLCDGHAITAPAPERAMVFQHYSLYPWLTVAENIRFCRRLGLFTRSRSSADVEAASGRADALLHLMGLAHVADAYPGQLSGGMQQRVAIGRALMSRPRVLLMDEPFGALDAQTREVMHDLILHVHRLEKTTVVFVTHDVEEAIYLGQRVVLMAPRPGRIDSVYEVPLPATRRQEMKHTQEFLQLKRDILARIRMTSGMQTDLDLLDQLSRAAAAA
ncbi:Aliphatic sulfonates import ATP-binding protein SsuB [Cupriavidus yeoncheonensis]|uniref:Aliphatic sulfonates import ATP-binding protein SsuB n=1 Tax=Cupriavidus yeoncheonensis TaxID=1462994 RepID=A0A916ISF5_9BURK|nr:ABC transporter ATP-binding protein [Cupriavidus yeoncheonensis]CAG2136762.1 Aliphatic sulfonates import ATP-binding protein SsuB [Cupriavidus yeoncheonensis]